MQQQDRVPWRRTQDELNPLVLAQLREVIGSEMRAVSAANAAPNADDTTLGDWLLQWLLEDVFSHRRRTTFERYRSAIGHILPVLGDLRLVDLRVGQIKTLLAGLKQAGFAPATRELTREVLGGALATAQTAGKLPSNVADEVPRIENEREEVIPPTREQVGRILARARHHRRDVFPFLRLVAYTGLRRGEALGLRWEDISFHGRSLRVRRSVSRTSLGLALQAPKTKAARRTVDVDQETLAIVARLYPGAGEGYVFPGKDAGPANPMRFTRNYQRIATQVGSMQKPRLHDLRHFHASFLIHMGVDMLMISRRLGHAQVETTLNLYGHLLPGTQREAAQRFASAMAREGGMLR